MKNTDSFELPKLCEAKEAIDYKIFRRASKLFDNPELVKLQSIHLRYKPKSTMPKFPKKSKTILPINSLKLLKKTQKFNTLCTFLLSVIIVVGSVYDCDKTFDNGYKLSFESSMFRLILIFLSAVQAIFVLLYHKYILKMKISYKILSKHSLVYQDREVFIRLMIELLFCVILLPPFTVKTITFGQIGVSQTLSVDDILLGFIMLRVLHLYKAYYEFSSYNSLKSRFYCNILGIQDEFRFTMRCFLKKHPNLSVLIMFVLSILLFGYLLHVYEQSVESSAFVSVWNGFWIVSYTESTIGYGEITPKTHLGRLIAILSSFFGVFMYSYTVMIVRNISELSSVEHKLFSMIKYKFNCNKVIKISAIVLIQRWWILQLKRRVRTSSINDLFKFNKQLNLFSFLHNKESQAINPTLSEEIQKIMGLPVHRMENLTNYLAPAVKSEKKVLKLLNIEQNFLKKIKKHEKRLKKMLGVKSGFSDDLMIHGFRSARNSIDSNRAVLKKLQGEAVKKMINTRIKRTSLSHTHHSLSSDEDFYSNR
jgi:hypothetical protein